MNDNWQGGGGYKSEIMEGPGGGGNKGCFKSFVIGALVVVSAASIPFGIFMSFYMDDPTWLWFCLPIFIFLS